MKIGIVKERNRSKKKPQKLDLFLLHYLKSGRKKVRLKGMYLYERPRTEMQKIHNRDTNYECEQIISKARREQRLGYYDMEDYSKEPASIVDWCREYVKELDGKLKAQSIHPYNKVISHFQEFFGNAKTFADFTLKDAENFKQHMRSGTVNRYKRKYKTNTVNTYLNRLKLMIDEAMKRGNLTHKRMNVMFEVGQYKTKRRIQEYINLDEYKLLDENMCLCKPIARAFKFSLITGLRTSDLMALRWKDIVKDVKGWHIYVKMEKTGEPIRIALTDEHLALCGERGNDEEVVFDYSMSNEEYMYFYTWIHNTFGGKKRVKEANDGITFHSARASFITNMLMIGTPAVRVQKYVGHADLKTTLSYYRGSTEMQEEDMQSFMDNITAERNVLKAKQLLS
jgi:integrase